MSNYQTISVRVEVKKALEEGRGDMDWSEYLLTLKKEADLAKKKRAAKEMKQLLSPEELEEIKRSSREFKEGFRLR